LIANALKVPSADHAQIHEIINVRNVETKRKLARVSVDREQIENASVLIVVRANTSHAVQLYGARVGDFYSFVDGAFASMLILHTATNEGVGLALWTRF
jgi:hypothetical protein